MGDQSETNGMQLVLKNGADQQEIEALRKELNQRLKNRKVNKTFDAEKYNGIIHVKENPLRIQKRLRDEWERDLS